MIVRAIKTRKLIPPKDDLLSVIRESKLNLKEKLIIVVTSKVVSIWEGQCIKIDKSKKDQKEILIKKEADLWLPKTHSKYNIMLTIKGSSLVASAGIDESNSKGYYTLWPKKPFESAKKIYSFIKKEYKLKNFGVIISDSHTPPMRQGAISFAIAYYGFYPLKNYIGSPDLFGRKFKFERANLVDALSASAGLVMGEGREQKPIAIIGDVEGIKFTTKLHSILISPKDDIYAPIMQSAKWQKKLK